MRWLSRTPAVMAGTVAVVLALLVSGCSSSQSEAGTSAAGPPGSAAPPSSGAAVAGLVSSRVVVPPGMDDDPFNVPRSVDIPAGWTMSVWARAPGRLAVWAPDGTLLVSATSNGQVLRLVPGGPGRPARPYTVLINGLDQPHGMFFAGSTLYVAESDRVDAYTYANGTVSAPRTVIAGLPDSKSPDLHGQYAHALKSVVVGPDGAVYVSVGSSQNVSPEDRDATPQRASILRIPPGGGPATPFARGVRNGTGLAFAPDGSLWTAVNNRDNIAYPFDKPYGTDTTSDFGKTIQAYVNDHPPEEIARLTPGRDLGWPFCNPDPDVDPGVAGSPRIHADVRFDRDVETNADGSKLDCGALAPIDQTMPAHSAPLGMSFTTAALPGGWGTGALVGVHGSWNRTPPRAPEVSFFAWNGHGLGDQRTLVGGFQNADGSRWGRPVGAVQGPDGAVYITDDEDGAVYRLAPPS